MDVLQDPLRALGSVLATLQTEEKEARELLSAVFSRAQSILSNVSCRMQVGAVRAGGQREGRDIPQQRALPRSRRRAREPRCAGAFPLSACVLCMGACMHACMLLRRTCWHTILCKAHSLCAVHAVGYTALHAAGYHTYVASPLFCRGMQAIKEIQSACRLKLQNQLLFRTACIPPHATRLLSLISLAPQGKVQRVSSDSNLSSNSFAGAGAPVGSAAGGG